MSGSRFGVAVLRYDGQCGDASPTAEGTIMVPPKKRAPQPENPHANGPNLDVLRADPRVVIRRRPPGPIVPFVPDIFVLPGTDVLELLGRRPRDEDMPNEREPEPEPDKLRESEHRASASQDEGTIMALPKKSNPEPENPHANGPNMEALAADPRVVIRRRPPGADLTPFVSNIRVNPWVDELELLGRRPRDEDESDE